MVTLSVTLFLGSFLFLWTAPKDPNFISRSNFTFLSYSAEPVDGFRLSKNINSLKNDRVSLFLRQLKPYKRQKRRFYENI